MQRMDQRQYQMSRSPDMWQESCVSGVFMNDDLYLGQSGDTQPLIPRPLLSLRLNPYPPTRCHRVKRKVYWIDNYYRKNRDMRSAGMIAQVNHHDLTSHGLTGHGLTGHGLTGHTSGDVTVDEYQYNDFYLRNRAQEAFNFEASHSGQQGETLDLTMDMFSTVTNSLFSQIFHGMENGRYLENIPRFIDYESRQYQSRFLQYPRPNRGSRQVAAPYQKPQRAAHVRRLPVNHGNQMNLDLGGALGQLRKLHNAPENLPVKDRYSKQDLAKLYRKAQIFNKSCKIVNQCDYFYRDKTLPYYINIKVNHDGVMEKYVKDLHGDPRSPINGRLHGLFFNIRVLPHNKQLPRQSMFGDRRLLIPVSNIVDHPTNLYFADFYCIKLAHYVTLVLTEPGSPSDTFCLENLHQLDIRDNGFFQVSRSILNNALQVRAPFRPIVEILFTENVDISAEMKNGAMFANVEMIGLRSGGDVGIRKNRKCKICNLQPSDFSEDDDNNIKGRESAADDHDELKTNESDVSSVDNGAKSDISDAENGAKSDIFSAQNSFN